MRKIKVFCEEKTKINILCKGKRKITISRVEKSKMKDNLQRKEKNIDIVFGLPIWWRVHTKRIQLRKMVAAHHSPRKMKQYYRVKIRLYAYTIQKHGPTVRVLF